jgi:hypothetical protein
LVRVPRRDRRQRGPQHRRLRGAGIDSMKLDFGQKSFRDNVQP